jgi:hypothetical protein
VSTGPSVIFDLFPRVLALSSCSHDFLVALVTLQMHMPMRISRTLNLNLHEEDAKQELVVAGQFV